MGIIAICCVLEFLLWVVVQNGFLCEFGLVTCVLVSSVEPSGVQALKNPNPLKDVEALDVLVVAVLF